MSIIEPAESVTRRALYAPLDRFEWRDSGNGVDFTLRGHAAVFNSLSGDLGGFREIITPGAFRSALADSPDVKLLYGHNADTLLPLARTKAGTMEVREDDHGLYVWARVAPTTFASDMRVAMERGDLDTMSFAFTMNDEGDDWAVDADGQVIRTIKPDGVRQLFEVSVVPFPAYEATSVAMRSEFDDAVKRGRIPGWAAPGIPAPDSPVEDSRSASRLAAFRLRRERVANAHPLIETE